MQILDIMPPSLDFHGTFLARVRPKKGCGCLHSSAKVRFIQYC
jgi:hypothetical protein